MPMITRRQFIRTASALAATGSLVSRVLARAEGLAGTGGIMEARRPFRVGCSEATLAGANLNDARAAFKIWGEEIRRSLDMSHSEMLPQVFVPSQQMIQMIRAGDIDCFAITVVEYSKVADLVDPSMMAVEAYAEGGIEYILLVHESSPYKKIEDLRGAKVGIHHHRDTVLLEPWLAILLATAGLPSPEQCFGAVESHEDLTQVILPLFFKRIQVAGVSRRAFEMATELNPQLGRDLRVIATSPKVVSDGFFFRQGCDQEDKHNFQEGLLRFRSIPAGRQCLALYQSSGFQLRPCSILKSSIDLIHQYDHLRKSSRSVAD